MKINKNQIIGILVAVVLVGGGVVYLVSQNNSTASNEAEKNSQQQQVAEQSANPVLNMAGVISQVNAEKNIVTINAAEGAAEIKLSLAADTEIIQLKFPFDPANPPKGQATFTPERVPIKVSALKSGDRILIETRTSLSGKTEINDVVRIQVLP